MTCNDRINDELSRGRIKALKIFCAIVALAAAGFVFAGSKGSSVKVVLFLSALLTVGLFLCGWVEKKEKEITKTHRRDAETQR